MRVLIVDDDLLLLEANKIFLESKGFEVKCVNDPLNAENDFRTFQPNIVLLDVKMPNMNGYELLVILKEIKKVPFIFMSSLEDAENKIKGFKFGADDYIVKPFNFEELYYRILARLNSSDEKFQSPKKCINIVGNIYYEDGYLICDNNKEAISGKEWSILKLLYKNPGKVFSANEIYEYIWKENSNNDTRVIRTYISTLRKKIIKVSGKDYIQSHWGTGYEIVSF